MSDTIDKDIPSGIIIVPYDSIYVVWFLVMDFSQIYIHAGGLFQLAIVVDT